MSTVTVTAKAGPAKTVTAQVISNVKSFFVDVNTNMLQVFINGPFTSPAKEYDIAAVSTFTVTISSGVYTITLS